MKTPKQKKCIRSPQYGKDENKYLHFYCENCGKEMDYDEIRLCKARGKPFKKGHKINLGKHWKIKDTSKMKGHIISDKTKKRMKLSHLGIKYPNRKSPLPISEKRRKRMSDNWKGEKHPNWKGGITSLTKLVRNSFKYRQWRSDIFERDNYICQVCGVKSGNGKTIYLMAHHKKEFSKIIEENNIKTLDQALACEELWNINNGETRCDKCHPINGRPKNIIYKF
jgi:hypothetical protein